MKRFLATSILTLTVTASTLFGGNLSALGVNNTAVAAAATIDSITVSKPTLCVNSRTANTANLEIGQVKGADGYKIYRACTKNGTYKCIGTTNNCNFQDTNLDASQSYCYKTKAYKNVNGKKVNSKCSSQVASASIVKKKNCKGKSANISDLVNKALKGSTATSEKCKIQKCKKQNCTTENCTMNNCKTNNCTTKKCTVKKCIVNKSKTTKPSTAKPSTTTTKPSTGTTTAAPSSSTNYDSNFANEVLRLVNIERANGGVGKLTMSQALVAPANKRAKEIAQSFSHTRPNGTQWSTVLDEFNVSVRAAGENLAYGYNTPEAVVEGWMNSPGHRANIMNDNFNKIGIGVYKDSKGTVYCTQLFSN